MTKVVTRVVAAGLMSIGLGVSAQAADLKLMTGPQGGSWYPLGGAIQNIMQNSMDGVSVTVLPLSFFHGASDFRQTRLYGWNELREELNVYREEYQPDFIASDGPDLAAVAGFAIDDKAAVRVFQDACDSGSAEACGYLGMHKMEGAGVALVARLRLASASRWGVRITG
mgnify:CR=1 FL=1